MTVPLKKFAPDMLTTERQPIYQDVIQRTEFIAKDFAGNKPTNKEKIISFFEAINRLDQEVGESLLMKGPEDLNIQFNSILHRSPYSHNIDAYKNDPLTVGLIDGDSPVIPPYL